MRSGQAVETALSLEIQACPHGSIESLEICAIPRLGLLDTLGVPGNDFLSGWGDTQWSPDFSLWDRACRTDPLEAVDPSDVVVFPSHLPPYLSATRLVRALQSIAPPRFLGR